MATFPLIFPSLSRQPAMDTSKKTEDDTIRDPMESGSQATRPRGTRVRRTWPFNVRNLVAEDVRALDEFFMSPSYAARGGNSFLFPTSCPIGPLSFRRSLRPILSLGGLSPARRLRSPSASALLRLRTVLRQSSSGTVATKTIAVATTVTGALNCDLAVPCKPGEVYVFTAALDAIKGTLAAGVLGAQVSVSYLNAAGGALSTVNGTAATIGVGWQTYGYQFTVPASAASFKVSLLVTLTNSTASAITLDGSASVSWDTVGCSLLTPLTPYGRMVGSQSLGCLFAFHRCLK